MSNDKSARTSHNPQVVGFNWWEPLNGRWASPTTVFSIYQSEIPIFLASMAHSHSWNRAWSSTWNEEMKDIAQLRTVMYDCGSDCRVILQNSRCWRRWRHFQDNDEIVGTLDRGAEGKATVLSSVKLTVRCPCTKNIFTQESAQTATASTEYRSDVAAGGRANRSSRSPRNRASSNRSGMTSVSKSATMAGHTILTLWTTFRIGARILDSDGLYFNACGSFQFLKLKRNVRIERCDRYIMRRGDCSGERTVWRVMNVSSN